MENKSQTTCTYCKGNGYFQLVTGGSETCPSCQGTGNVETAATTGSSSS
ncbi:YuiA family protein [Aneurinibacillus terranovensis]|nr:YuiA family protein [Aneurinibacillus terranovensis]